MLVFASVAVGGGLFVEVSSAKTTPCSVKKKASNARKAYALKNCQEYLLKLPGSPLPTHEFLLLISDRVLSLNAGESEVKGTAKFIAPSQLAEVFGDSR